MLLSYWIDQTQEARSIWAATQNDLGKELVFGFDAFRNGQSKSWESFLCLKLEHVNLSLSFPQFFCSYLDDLLKKQADSSGTELIFLTF